MTKLASLKLPFSTVCVLCLFFAAGPGGASSTEVLNALRLESYHGGESCSAFLYSFLQTHCADSMLYVWFKYGVYECVKFLLNVFCTFVDDTNGLLAPLTEREDDGRF